MPKRLLFLLILNKITKSKFKANAITHLAIQNMINETATYATMIRTQMVTERGLKNPNKLGAPGLGVLYKMPIPRLI